ncbi:helix-turn-helix domain-containing protein, partial [Pisciglobus halotolerans]
MAKYSFEFKRMVVKEYIKGFGGYASLAEKHGIKSYGQVRDWVKVYQEFGEEGLQRRTTNRDYTVQFKLDAVELYSRTELTYRETANRLGLTTPALIK